ncbi:MAG: DUF4336 domain-containing protein [Myxococcota bacterium]|nr:DUF4336 domain-containing protein [Myxococcota bacterium]
MNGIQELSENIFIAHDGDFKFFGLLQIGTRMTVIRLGGNKLWLHSPIRLTAELKRELDALGEVAWIVCPNQFHHMFAGDYMAAYGQAVSFGAPSLYRRRKDLSFNHKLDGDFVLPPAWHGHLESVFIGGSAFEETVFYHGPSRVLVTCDLIEYFTGHDHWLTRIYLKLMGTYQHPSFPKIIRTWYKDKPLASKAMTQILNWDFDRMIISHGDCVLDDDPKGALRKTYPWLLV